MFLAKYTVFKLYYICCYIDRLINLPSVFTPFSAYPIFVYFFMLFISSIAASLIFTSFLGVYGVFLVMFISLLLLVAFAFPYLFYFLKSDLSVYVALGRWVFISFSTKVNFCLMFDQVSFSFMFLTLSIALFVNMFAFSYFRYEPLVDRFLIFLNLFVVSMVILVLSSNLIMLFLG